MNRHRFVAASLVLVAALITLGGCGRNSSADSAAEPVQIRTPVPTFTPTAPADLPPDTSIAPVAPIVAAAPAAAEQPVLAAPAAASTAAEKSEVTPQGIGGPVVEAPAGGIPPVAVINTELVNSRTGPDTSFPIATVLGRGEDFDITGRSDDGAWWRICCLVDLREVWVNAEFADSDGPTDRVPVAQAGETSALALARQGGAERVVAAPAPEQAAAAPAAEVASAAPVAELAPTAEPQQSAASPVAEDSATQPEAAVAAAAAEDPAKTGAFELGGQERFAESSVVRVFAYIFAENQGIEGYSLRVTKDGAEQTVSGSSFGGQPGMTWPIADDRQRFQNFKVEFPSVPPAGVWTVELTRDGAVVGPAASFTLTENDAASELYVRYKRN